LSTKTKLAHQFAVQFLSELDCFFLLIKDIKAKQREIRIPIFTPFDRMTEGIVNVGIHFLRQFLIPFLIFKYQRRFFCNKAPEKDIGDFVLKPVDKFKKSKRETAEVLSNTIGCSVKYIDKLREKQETESNQEFRVRGE
jgi:hypothetical protein